MKSTTHSSIDRVLRDLEHWAKFGSPTRVLAVGTSEQLQFKLYKSKRGCHGSQKKTNVTYNEQNREETNRHPQKGQEGSTQIGLGWPPSWRRTPGGLWYGTVSRFSAQPDRRDALRQGTADPEGPREAEEVASRHRRLRIHQTKTSKQGLSRGFRPGPSIGKHETSLKLKN